jgi:segregation and condensation protein B
MIDESLSPEPRLPLHRIIEAILFASQKPVSAKELASIFKGAADASKDNPDMAMFAKVKGSLIEAAIEQLEREYSETGRSFEVRESAAGWQLVTRADFAPWLRQLFPENRQARLSAPAMETLAIIAYRQPITRADIEAVRGVAVDGVMQTLLDRNLVRIAGRSEIAGRPLLYETSQFFMDHFGLKNLDDLPNASELRRVALPTAEPPTPPVDEPAPAETEILATEAQVNEHSLNKVNTDETPNHE